MPNLITLADIRAVRDVSTSLKETFMDQFIDDAQFEDLKPLLGELLFSDVLNRPTATDKGNYPLLRTGGSYTYAGDTYYHPGIKRVLIDFAYARYRFFGNDKDTPFGSVNKVFENGDNTSIQRNRDVYASLRKSAERRWEDVYSYLNRAGQLTETKFEYWFTGDARLRETEENIVINTVTLR